LALAALLLVASLPSCSPFRPRRPPNILLISIDSLRADHVHAYGYPRETTPQLDRLAGEGALFQTVVAPTSWTLPSHFTLFTSLAPEEHGVRKEKTQLREGVVLLAEVLRDAGYATGAFVSGPYLRSIYGFSRGFEHYDDASVISSQKGGQAQNVTSPRLVRLAASWLQRWAEEDWQRPFFLFLHLFDVHFDYVPPPPWDRRFDPDYQGPIDGRNLMLDSRINAGMSARDLAHLVALYDGEIAFTDHHLGMIRRRLQKLGVLDDTLVVVTSDHGDEFFEHAGKGHRRTLYDEALLVPLVMRYPPRVPAGARVERPVRLGDVAVTLLSLAGVARPPGFGSRGAAPEFAAQDLTPLLDGRGAAALPPPLALSELLNTRETAIRTPRFKLIHHENGAYQLYDLAADTSEQRDLGGSDPEQGTELLQSLVRWRDGLVERGAVAKPLELSPDHEAELRALGYLE
jgi:arylsulfatase A-like enzyme